MWGGGSASEAGIHCHRCGVRGDEVRERPGHLVADNIIKKITRTEYYLRYYTARGISPRNHCLLLHEELRFPEMHESRVTREEIVPLTTGVRSAP
jgi:hypothetical protein